MQQIKKNSGKRKVALNGKSSIKLDKKKLKKLFKKVKAF